MLELFVHLALAMTQPAHAQLDVRAADADLVERYCDGMLQQFAMPDGTKADCISDAHAIEVAAVVETRGARQAFTHETVPPLVRSFTGIGTSPAPPAAKFRYPQNEEFRPGCVSAFRGFLLGFRLRRKG